MSRIQRLAGPAGGQGPFVPVGVSNRDKRSPFCPGWCLQPGQMHVSLGDFEKLSFSLYPCVPVPYHFVLLELSLTSTPLTLIFSLRGVLDLALGPGRRKREEAGGRRRVQAGRRFRPPRVQAGGRRRGWGAAAVDCRASGPAPSSAGGAGRATPPAAARPSREPPAWVGRRRGRLPRVQTGGHRRGRSGPRNASGRRTSRPGPPVRAEPVRRRVGGSSARPQRGAGEGRDRRAPARRQAQAHDWRWRSIVFLFFC